MSEPDRDGSDACSEDSGINDDSDSDEDIDLIGV